MPGDTPNAAREALPPERQRQLALYLGALVQAQKNQDRTFKQDQIAEELQRLTGSSKASEASYVSSFLKGQDRGLTRYLRNGEERMLEYLGVFARTIGRTVDELLRGPEAETAELIFHPAWPELGRGDGLWVDRAPRHSFENVLKRAQQLKAGEHLLVVGAPGLGKSTLLKRLKLALASPEAEVGKQAPLRFVDDCADVQAAIDETRSQRFRLVVAAENAPGGQIHAHVELIPWTREQIADYLERLIDGASQIPGCPVPPLNTADSLDRNRLESLVATPRELGFFARHAAESGAIPRAAADLPPLLLRARLDAAMQPPSAGLEQSKMLLSAFEAAATAFFDRDPPGACFAGLPRTALAPALQGAAAPTVDDARSRIERLLKVGWGKERRANAAAIKAQLERLLEQLEAPNADQMIEQLARARLLHIDGDRVRPAEPGLAAATCATQLVRRADGWRVLVETIVDGSREPVRMAAAHHLDRVQDRIDELLKLPTGAHLAALRFAAALAAHGKDEATPEQVSTLLASAIALLDRAWTTGLFVLDAPLLTSLRAISRRFRHVLPRVTDDAAIDALLAQTTPVVRRIVRLAPEQGEPSLRQILYERVPLRQALGLMDEASRADLLAQLLPWQDLDRILDPTGQQHGISRRRTEVLLDAIADGNPRAIRIACGADSDHVAVWLASSLDLSLRIDALEAWGPKDGEERLLALQSLIYELTTRQRAVRAHVAERVRKAICRFIAECGDQPSNRKRGALEHWQLGALWIDGLTEAGAVQMLEAEYQHQEEVAGRLGNPSPLIPESLLDIAKRLYRLGAKDRLRALAAGRWPRFADGPIDLRHARFVPGMGHELDKLSMDATRALLDARDAEGLRPLLENKEADSARSALDKAREELGTAIWMADHLDDAASAGRVVWELPQRGPARDAARRWARNPRSPFRRRAAFALLTAPIAGAAAEHAAIAWLLASAPTIYGINHALRHPDEDVKRAGLRAMEQSLKEIRGQGAPETWMDALCRRLGEWRGDDLTENYVGRFVWDLTSFARTAAEHCDPQLARPALRQLVSFAQEASSLESRPDDELIGACGTALRRLSDPKWQDVLARPFGERNGPPTKTSRIRTQVLGGIRLDAVSDRRVLRVLQEDENEILRIGANKRLIELERPALESLLQELRGSGFLRQVLAGVRRPGDERAEAIALFLQDRAPRALAELHLETVRQLSPEERRSALMQHDLVASLDPERGAAFLDALLETPPTPDQQDPRSEP